MKIYILTDNDGQWYPAQAPRQFKQYSRLSFVNHPQAADLIWIFAYYMPLKPLLALPETISRYLKIKTRLKKSLQGKPVVTTIHHLLPSKKYIWQKKLDLLNPLTTVWHFPSPRNQQLCLPYIKAPTKHLPYWIDTQQFFPLSPSDKRSLREKYNLPLQQKIIGSFQRDTEADLKTPKWEKGPDIFCDIVEQLSKKQVFVVLSGARRHYIEKRLNQAGINYLNLGTVPFAQLNNLYNMLDLYLVSSRFEGGPQSLLESMATKTPIYSTPVGISDLLSPTVIFKNIDQAVKLCRLPYSNDILEQHYRKSQDFSAPKIIPLYEQFFHELLQK